MKATAKKTKQHPVTKVYLLTVDPGVGGTGWAYWWPKEEKPETTGVLRAPVLGEWLERVYHIAGEFEELLHGWPRVFRPELVVFEDQSIWDDSVAAHAAKRSGGVVKLAQLTGMLACKAMDNGCRVWFCSVRAWKGQLPKRAVQKRIERILGKKYPNHSADAVGIGLYLKGLL